MISKNRLEQILHAAGLVLATLFFAFLFTSNSFAAIQRPYTATADYIMFDIDKKIIYCEDHTELNYGMLRVQAKAMRVDVKYHILYAEGNVVIQTMRPLTMRESSEESREAGLDDEELVEIDADDAASESNRKMEERTESERLGNLRTYEGDVLIYDLEHYAGVMMKTHDVVEKIYIMGDTLDEVSDMPSIGEGGFLYEEPEIVANAWTASRIRVSPDGHYEGWKTNLWLKGNKVFPVALPYYTNSGRNITPGNLRLKSVRYSSNSDWNIGASYRYRELKGKEGTVDLRYRGKGNSSYSATLNQRLKFTNNLTGSFALSNLFTNDSAYRMSLSRVGGGGRMQSYSINYRSTESRRYSFNDNRQLFGMRVSSMLDLNKYNGDDSQDNMRMMVRFDGDTRSIDKSQKYRYRFNSNISMNNRQTQDSDTNMFVGVSAFRSAIKISETQKLNTSYNFGYGRSTEGYSEGLIGTSLGYIIDVGDNKMVGLTYKANNSRTRGSSSARQYVSMAYSYNKYKVMNMRFSTSYNLRETEMDTLSTRFDYVFNSRCSLWTDLIYDIKNHRFNMKIFSVKYDLMGNMLNTRWNVESNDFVFDMTSKF